jgi:hypothetical protein
MKINMVWMMGVWGLGSYGLHHDRTDPDLLRVQMSTLSISKEKKKLNSTNLEILKSFCFFSSSNSKSYGQVLPGYTMDDIIGSPYAVTNYTTNSELGTDEDLAWFRKQLSNLGMKLMLDFVPNHTAVDCKYSNKNGFKTLQRVMNNISMTFIGPWTTSHREYYVRAPQGTTPDPNKYLPSGIAFGGDGYGSWT